MHDTINALLQWLNAHPNLSGLATFIISAGESVAIIGTIVPGTVMMTAIGTLAGAGVIPLWETLAWAILGAIVGDGISYWLGYHLKDRLKSIWPFRTHAYILENGERFFRKHGGKSVFIGRFVGPVRALVPLIAGMLGMKPSRFTIANITSAIGWAPLYMLPGILLGAASLELPPDIAIQVILMLLLVTFFIVFCIWLFRKLLILINQQTHQALTSLWNWIYYSRFRPVATLLKHYDPKNTHGQLTLAFYFSVTSIAFLWLAFYIYSHPSSTLFINNVLFYFFRSIRTPSGDDIMLCLTLAGQRQVLLPVITAVFVWLLWTRYFYTALHALVLGILTVGSSWVIKHLVHSPRPWGILYGPESFSFPSGHTTLSTTFYIAIALLIIRAANIKRRWLIYLFTGIVVAAISISRLYLGAHWFTDVLGGWLLSAALLMLISLSYNRKQETKLKPRGIVITFFLSFVVFYSVFFACKFNQLKHNYSQLPWPTQTISLPAWWEQQAPLQPIYRVNRFGISQQIFNLQWLGDINDIKKTLINNGWQIPPEGDWIAAIERIADVQSAEHLPLVSPIYLDQQPMLVLTKNINGDKKLIALRLWRSQLLIKSSSQPLWVGSIDVVPRTYSWLFKRTRSQKITINSTILFFILPTQYDVKQINVITNQPETKYTSSKQAVILVKPKKFKKDGVT